MKKFYDLDISTDISDSDFFSSSNKPSKGSTKKNNKNPYVAPEPDVLPEPNLLPTDDTTNQQDQSIIPTDNTTPGTTPSDTNLVPDIPDQTTQN